MCDATSTVEVFISEDASRAARIETDFTAVDGMYLLETATKIGSFQSGQTTSSTRKTVPIMSLLSSAGIDFTERISSEVGLVLILKLAANGDCRPLYRPREYSNNWKAQCASTGCRITGKADRSSEIIINTLHSPFLEINSGGLVLSDKIFIGGTSESKRLVQYLQATTTFGVDSSGKPLIGYQSNQHFVEDMRFEPYAAKDIQSLAVCVRVEDKAEEQCSMMVPLESAFAVVRVLGFSNSEFNLKTTFVEQGMFTEASEYGKCIRNDDDGYWAGPFCSECYFKFEDSESLRCSEYKLKNCKDADCYKTSSCNDDPETGNTFQKCSCPDGFVGLYCEQKCACVNGVCDDSGRCKCYASEEQGFWVGEVCDECPNGRWGVTCERNCECQHGTCLTGGDGGGCEPGSCSRDDANGYWDGINCDVCAENYYGSQCKISCITHCEAVIHGVCSSEQCICPQGFLFNSDNICEECTDSRDCHDHGTCVLDGNNRCKCHQNNNQGHWDVRTNCSICLTSHYGEQCDQECMCSSHGTCSLTGECQCQEGWTGERCSECSEGFIGENCESVNLLSPRNVRVSIPYNYEVRDEGMVRRSSLSSGAMLWLHSGKIKSLNGEQHDRPQIGDTELLITSTGVRGTGNRITVSVHSKPYSASVQWDSATHTTFSVHGRTPTSDIFGDEVVGILQSDIYIVFIVNSEDPYVVRMLTSVTMHMHSEVGFPSEQFDESRVCRDQVRAGGVRFGCPEGTEVTISNLSPPLPNGEVERGIVVSGTGSYRCVKLLYPRQCVTANNDVRCNVCPEGQISLSTSNMKPVRNVVKWREFLPSTNPIDVVSWSFSENKKVITALLLVSDRTVDSLEPFAYHIRQIAVEAPNENTRSFYMNDYGYELVTFDPRVQFNAWSDVHSVFVHEDATSHYMLIFGRNKLKQTIFEKIFLPHEDDVSFRSVLTLPLELCTRESCERVDIVKAIPDSTRVLLFILTAKYLTESDGYYLIYNFDVSDLKNQARQVNKCLGVETCDELVWNILTSTASRIGVSSVVIDNELNQVYAAVGRGVKDINSPHIPTQVVQFGLKQLKSSNSRSLQSKVVLDANSDLEIIVAMHIDPERRAIFTLSAKDNTSSIAVANMYDVLRVSPEAVDAGGGTIVDVTGIGFPNPELFPNPTLLIGDTITTDCVINPSTQANVLPSIITCTARRPDTYISCQGLTLEISIDEERRWTEAAVGISYISTPRVLQIGAKGNSANVWTFPHEDGVYPTTPHTVTSFERKSAAISDSITIPGPDTYYSVVENPQGRFVRQLQRSDEGCYGPADRDVIITIFGSGFLPRDTMLCRYNNSKPVPGTFLTAMKALCLVPKHDEPISSIIELTMDGQTYSEIKGIEQRYTSIGGVSKLEAFAICRSELIPCDSKVRIQSGRVLPRIEILLKDKNDRLLGETWTNQNTDPDFITAVWRWTPDDDSILVDISGFPSIQKAPIESGTANFTNLLFQRPQEGLYTVIFTYTTPFRVFEGSIKVSVSGGAPYELRFMREPTTFSNNRNPLTVQPSFRLVDEAGNTVRDNEKDQNYKIVASIRLEEDDDYLRHDDLVLEDRESFLHTDLATYNFAKLRIFSTTKRGRQLQFRKLSTGSYHEYVQNSFFLTFRVTQNGVVIDTPTMRKQTKMTISDCSTSYMGARKLAWVEPEEQPVETATPITIKGFEFHSTTTQSGTQRGQYYCIFRNVNRVWQQEVKATFLDSCTLLCDLPSESFRASPKMSLVAPALKCVDEVGDFSEDETRCVDQTVKPFNETSIKVEYYHKYIGTGTSLRIWNTEVVLPEWRKEFSPYTRALSEETARAQLITLDSNHAMGIRRINTGDYINQQREHPLFNYSVLQLARSIMNEDSVIRSDDWVTIAGGKFWTDIDKEWQHGDTVRKLELLSPEDRDFALRVAIVDDSVGVNGWRGSWVADSDSIRRFEESPMADKRSTGIDIRLDIVPVTNISSVVVVESGGSTSATARTKKTISSYVTFPTIRIKSPAAGVYYLRMSPSGTSSIRFAETTIRILEGLPHRVDFSDSTVIPKATLTRSEPLTVQPSFIMLDKSGNRVKEFTAANNIYVRVASMSPWPRCIIDRADCASTSFGCPKQGDPGMWGVEERSTSWFGLVVEADVNFCYWATPEISDQTLDAIFYRERYNPKFDETGLAAFGRGGSSETELTIWAENGNQSFNITWEFYGEALTKYGYDIPPLSLSELIQTSRCAAGCSNNLNCEYEPSSVGVSDAPGRSDTVGDDITIYGDYLDFATGEQTEDNLRVIFLYNVNGTEESCVVRAQLRDPCSVTTVFPRCHYLCQNFYSPDDYTWEDRVSCCQTGKKLDLSQCLERQSATLSNRVIATLDTKRDISTLQSSSTQSIERMVSSPSTSSMKVTTRCTSSTTCSEAFASENSGIGPSLVGMAAQFGLMSSQRLLGVLSYSSSKIEGPFVVNITVKDAVGTDLFHRDNTTGRRVRIFVEGQNLDDLKSWDGPNSPVALKHDNCRLTNDTSINSQCVQFPDGDSAEIIAGVATIKFNILSPRSRTYGVRLIDVTDPSLGITPLPSCERGGDGVLPYIDSFKCATIATDFRHIHNFLVTNGKPYRLGWSSQPTDAVTNFLSETVEYAVQVLDFAGNVLTRDQVVPPSGDSETSGGVFYLQLSTEVAQLRDPLLSPTLFERRNEPWTETRRKELEALACNFELTKSVERTDDYPSHSTFESSSSNLIRFNLRKFKVWNGMTCKLSFTVDSRSISAEAINLASDVSVLVSPRSCCDSITDGEGCSQFGYSFEFGCWNFNLDEVIDGPRNPITSLGLSGVTGSSPYTCLTECGECEEGILCDGTTSLSNKKGFWREPVTYKAHECETEDCKASSLPALDAAVTDKDRSNVQCNPGSKGPFCGICIHDSTPVAPYGYGKDTASCVSCYEPFTNYLVLSILAIAVLIVIVVMVAVNMNTGVYVTEAPQVSVMIKILMNHLQVLLISFPLVFKISCVVFFYIKQTKNR